MLFNYAKNRFILLFDHVKKTKQKRHVNTTCLLFKFWVDHIIIQSTVNQNLDKVPHSGKKSQFIWGKRIVEYCKKYCNTGLEKVLQSV